MDPSSLISQSALPEMWRFPMVGMAPAIRPAAAGMGIRDASAGESTVTEQSGGNWSRKRRRGSGPSSAAASEDETSKLVSTSCGGIELTDGEAKHLEVGKSRIEKSASKADVEASSTGNKQDQTPEPSKQDYIHVRARRGQATDSHSLAERARREKISERMKILQDLVPGCNKVIGKASVLDEIINYIQALQNQVEFLSMKLEAVNSQSSAGLEGYPPKDTYETRVNLAFSSQPTREYGQESTTEWLHMQVGGAFGRVT